MERKEQIAWDGIQEKETVHPVELRLTADEVADLGRALGIYRANSTATARERPLSFPELMAHATVGKVLGQLEGWQPPKPSASPNGRARMPTKPIQ